MKIFQSKTHSDQEGPEAEEGKLGIIYSSKEDLLALCDFFDEVRQAVTKNKNVHMQFRDSHPNWNSKDHIDFEVNMV